MPDWLVLLCCLYAISSLFQTSTAISLWNGENPAFAREAERYEFSEEEAQAYYKKRGLLPMPQASNPAVSLKKRSVDSSMACLEMNNSVYYQDGHLVGRHTYKWLSAKCENPFLSRKFNVTCEHTFEMMHSPWSEFIDADEHKKMCTLGRVCVPAPATEVNGIGQHGPHLDIECVPSGGLAKPVAWRSPVWQPAKHCSSDIRVPGPHAGKTPIKGRTYLLSESVERADGWWYDASLMYIEDHTSKFFKPWRRGEMKQTDVTAAEFTLYKNEDRIVRFCAETAKGAAFWLVMHYGVYDITGKGMHIHAEDTPSIDAAHD